MVRKVVRLGGRQLNVECRDRMSRSNIAIECRCSESRSAVREPQTQGLPTNRIEHLDDVKSPCSAAALALRGRGLVGQVLNEPSTLQLTHIEISDKYQVSVAHGWQTSDGFFLCYPHPVLRRDNDSATQLPLKVSMQGQNH